MAGIKAKSNASDPNKQPTTTAEHADEPMIDLTDSEDE
jgi:hypothetical protein